MLSLSPLQHLPIGQPIDSVRLAILRESAYAAETWHHSISTSSRAVFDVLAAEQRLSRQLGALGILADVKLYRRLRERLIDDDAEYGSAFVAGFVLLRHDRAASESCVFTQWLQRKPGPVRAALGGALALCGLGNSVHTSKLAQALMSRDADVVQPAASLVAKLGPLRAWPTPHMATAAGLCAALKLMRAGAIAPLPTILSGAAEHPALQVRQAGLQTHQLLFPRAALMHARRLAHQGRDMGDQGLRLMGLLHDASDPAAAPDLPLLCALSAQPATAEAAIDALGLTGCGEAAQVCLQAAQRDPGLVGPAARSLQTLFGLDDEFWAPFAGEDGELGSDVLQAAYNAVLSETPDGAPADFQPRHMRGLVARLRHCDMAHLRARADECHMRSGGRARLHPWAFLTPQLGPAGNLSKQASATQAFAALTEPRRPALQRPQGPNRTIDIHFKLLLRPLRPVDVPQIARTPFARRAHGLLGPQAGRQTRWYSRQRRWCRR